MAPITSHVEIARSCEQVYAYATDQARFPEWQDDVVSARALDVGDAGQVGSRFVTVRRIGRSERSMTQQITVSQPPTRWSARGVDGPVRPRVALTIEPLEGNTRARVTVRMDFEGHGIGRLSYPWSSVRWLPGELRRATST